VYQRWGGGAAPRHVDVQCQDRAGRALMLQHASMPFLLIHSEEQPGRQPRRKDVSIISGSIEEAGGRHDTVAGETDLYLVVDGVVKRGMAG